jgi:hypothetical protein
MNSSSLNGKELLYISQGNYQSSALWVYALSFGAFPDKPPHHWLP